MNRNAISRLVEVSLLAGIAISLVGAGSVFAQVEDRVAKPVTAAAKVRVVPADRHKIATQKLMRNPWEKPTEVAAATRSN